jgi:hypothetical protein
LKTMSLHLAVMMEQYDYGQKKMGNSNFFKS